MYKEKDAKATETENENQEFLFLINNLLKILFNILLFFCGKFI